MKGTAGCFVRLKKALFRDHTKFEDYYRVMHGNTLFGAVSSEHPICIAVDDRDLLSFLVRQASLYAVYTYAVSYKLNLTKCIKGKIDLPDCRCLIIEAGFDAHEGMLRRVNALIAQAQERGIACIVIGETRLQNMVGCAVGAHLIDKLCLTSESLSEVFALYKICYLDEYYNMTQGMPVLAEALLSDVLAGNASIFETQFQATLARAYGWLMRADLSTAALKFRTACLIFGGFTVEAMGLDSSFKKLKTTEFMSPYLRKDADGLKLVGSFDKRTRIQALKSAKTFITTHEIDLIRWVDRLMAAGDVEHAGIILAVLPPSFSVSKRIARIPFELINHGYAQLVEQTLSYLPELSRDERLGVQMAAAVLKGNVATLDSIVCSASQTEFVYNTTYKQAFMSLKALQVLQGKLERGAASAAVANETNDPLTQDLYALIQATDRLLEGDIEGAYMGLLMASYEEIQTVSAALIHLLQVVVGLLVGDPAAYNERKQLHRTLVLITESRIESIVSYAPVVKDCIDNALLDESHFFTIERVVSGALRRKDYFVAALFMLFALLQDLKLRNYLRAYTKAQSLQTIVTHIKHKSLIELQACLIACVQIMLKEPVSLEICAPESIYEFFLHAIVATMHEVYGVKNTAKMSVYTDVHKLNMQMVPTGIFWFADAMLNVNADLTFKLQDILPYSWNKDLKAYRKRIADIKTEAQADRIQAQQLETVKRHHGKLHIRLMGACEVSASGTIINEDKWIRSASKNLLLYLAVADGHKLSRADALDLLWPNKDYIVGRGCLYTALSSLKKTLGYDQEVSPYIICSQGYIALNPEAVSVDFDHIFDLSRRIRNSQDRTEQMFLALEMEEAYVGGLWCPVGDASGLFEAARNRVRDAFCDAMHVVAEAAYKAEAYKRCIWYARLAINADRRREDVLILLFKALQRTNRKVEILELFEQTRAHFITSYGIMPSQLLQDIYEDVRRLTPSYKPVKQDCLLPATGGRLQVHDDLLENREIIALDKRDYKRADAS